MGNLRSATRPVLALALGLLAVPVLSTAAPAGVAQPPVIVTGRLVCPANQFEITISNPTADTYQVEVLATRTIGGEDDPITATIDPSETETIAVDVSSGTPVDITVTGDADFPDQQFLSIFGCPRVVDIAATTPQDTPVVIDLQGPCSTGADAPNGTVEQVDNFTIRYTPDPGFVGVDTFDYSCTASAEQEGTVTVTVTPLQAPPPPPAQPVPEPPTFTG